MGESLRFEDYLTDTELRSLLASLNPGDTERLTAQVEHFTVKEAEHRDEIVLTYFGEEGMARIADTVAREITANPVRDNPAILDVGAGIGTFTLPIMSRVKGVLPRASFYAMDLTPAMLRILAGRTGEVRPFIGLAENIPGSIRHAQRHLKVPDAFDAILSTLTLHHCPQVQRVFASFRQVLSPGGRAVVVDLCEHPFSEFREEMGDYHLGFNLHELQEVALWYFDQVKVQTLPGISCSCSGRSADIFTATMTVRNRP